MMLWLAFAYGLVWGTATFIVYQLIKSDDGKAYDLAWAWIAGAFWPLLILAWAIMLAVTPRDR